MKNTHTNRQEELANFRNGNKLKIFYLKNLWTFATTLFHPFFFPPSILNLYYNLLKNLFLKFKRSTLLFVAFSMEYLQKRRRK